MKTNLFTKITLLVLITLIPTACAGLQPASNAKPPLRVEFTQSWGDYTLLVAKEQGFFEKYGVEVEPVYYDALSDTYPDLAAGQIDGALIAVGDVININRIAPMKVVALKDNGGDDAVIVGPEINSIRDLRGKTIGIVLGSQYEQTVVEMLQSVNMSTENVNIVALNPKDALTALQSDRVQAAYVWEPFLSKALASGFKSIYPVIQLHSYPSLIVFSKSIVENRPEDVRAFLKGWFQGTEYRQQHAGETRDLAAKYIGVKANDVPRDDKLRMFSVADNKSLFDIRTPNSIYSTTRITSNYMVLSGLLSEKIDPLELLDPSYLP
jgi:NitT/TauT family transport system substrate-binding protein